ncbi:MAG: hypothetical protein E6K80_09225 [Candidatus Eisenbacteria bacterium]|uniref:Uncharacterized protein n=1 Tax=Eiseniibacteriota bacterium TaxID=2212470 RepID=A0A538U2U7_UNCEI|nr:MAG: hypothetical protein E6K80_09225 [Candidatus Eisenbacteria bacterium]
MAVGGGFDELGRDAHAIAGAQHRAFDDRVDAQLARDVRQRAADALEAHGGGARDDAQRPDLGQVGDQRLGHAVGEVLLLGVAREVLEREHGDRLDTRRRRGASRRAGRDAPELQGDLARVRPPLRILLETAQRQRFQLPTAIS